MVAELCDVSQLSAVVAAAQTCFCMPNCSGFEEVQSLDIEMSMTPGWRACDTPCVHSVELLCVLVGSGAVWSTVTFSVHCCAVRKMHWSNLELGKLSRLDMSALTNMYGALHPHHRDWEPLPVVSNQ